MTSPTGEEPDTIPRTPPQPQAPAGMSLSRPDQPAATALDDLDPHHDGVTDQAPTTPVDTAPPSASDKRHALADLRLRIRRELANAILDGHLDPDHANTICDNLDLDRLPLQWRIHMTMTVRCLVSAVAESEAVDLAETLIAGALGDTVHAVDVSFEHRNDALAEPDGIADDAIDALMRL